MITGLQTGGAETMLCKVIENTAWDNRVLSMEGPGALDARVLAAGAALASLDLKGPRPVAGSWRALRATFKGPWRPDVIQGWMYHGNLAAWLLSRAVPRAALAWNIRQSLYDLRFEKPASAKVIRINAWLSRSPGSIICNSKLAIGQHQAFGFCPERWNLIPNGFDLGAFRKSEGARAALRSALGIPADAFLVGQVARVHPSKDHPNMIQAIAQASARIPGIRLLLAGQGATLDNAGLVGTLRACGILDRTCLLGERPDTASVYPALDCLVSASASEGFPNVLGEALACEVPCVATRVGDSEWALGGNGILVPPGDPVALAEAVHQLHAMGAGERARLGALGRAYVERTFSIGSVAQAYDLHYHDLAGMPR